MSLQPRTLEALNKAATELIRVASQPRVGDTPAPEGGAVNSKTQQRKEEEAAAASLFGDAKSPLSRRITTINVMLTFTRAPRTHRVPLYFTLPHAIYANKDICVVTAPPQRTYKDELAAAEPPIPQVKKIIDVTKLETKFTDPVVRRGLAKAFDVFFVHSQLTKYPKMLTGEFLSHSTPVWMDPDTKFVESIRKTMNIAVVPRRGHSTISVAIGDHTMPPAHIVSNAQSLLEQLSTKLDAGLQDLLSASLTIAMENNTQVHLPFYAQDLLSRLGLSLPEFAAKAQDVPFVADTPAKRIVARRASMVLDAEATPATETKKTPARKTARPSVDVGPTPDAKTPRSSKKPRMSTKTA